MSPRSRLILTIAALVVVVLALAAILIYPQFGKLKDLDERIAQAQAQIDQAKALLEQRQAIKSQAAQTDTALLRLSNQVPESPELPSLIIELQDTANDAGVEFRTLTPSEPEQKNGYAAVVMSMDVSGEWADAIDFMRRLGKLTRQVRMVGLTVTPAAPPEGEEDVPQQVQLSFSLEVYTLAPAGSATGATPPPPPAQ